MIGEVRHIDAAYLQSWLVGTHWGDWRTEERWLWRLSGAHGSRGALGDVGIHILDFASYVADQKPGLGALPHEGVRQGGGRPHRRLRARRQRQLRHVDRVRRRRARRRACQPLDDRLRQRHEARRLRHAGRRWRSGSRARRWACASAPAPDVHTQTWREVDCPPVPNTYETFIDAVRTRRDAGAELPPRRRAAARAGPRASNRPHRNGDRASSRRRAAAGGSGV